MGRKRGSKRKSPVLATELFLLLILVCKVAAIVHQVS